MSKEEYINNLKGALQEFEEDLVQEIVTDYEERFIVGIENGKTEEQIMVELGSVEQLVMELKELQVFDTSSVTDGKIEKKRSNILENKINQTEDYREEDIVEEQNKKIEQTKENAGNVDWKFENLMKNVGKIIEGAVKKVKRKHFEDNSTFFEDMEKESDEMHNITQFGEANGICHKIVVDAGIGDVKIQKTNESIVKVECHYYSHKTAMIYPFYTEQQQDVFYVGLHKVKDIQSAFFQFQLAPAVKIEVFVPQTIQEIEVTTSSGNVELQEVERGSLKIHSASGSIKLLQLLGEDYSIETMSGSITAINVKANKAKFSSKSGSCNLVNVLVDTLSTSSMSGSLAIQGLQAETVSLNTISGSQTIKDIKVQELQSSAVSGSISILDSEAQNMIQSSVSGRIVINANSKEYHLKSTSGTISLTNHSDATIYANNTSGAVKMNLLNTIGNYDVQMRSVSGACKVSGNFRKEMEEVTYKIEAKTISGAVLINFEDEKE